MPILRRVRSSSNRSLLLIALLVGAGCSSPTTYRAGDGGSTDFGFSSTDVTEQITLIRFVGNDAEEARVLRAFVLRRAAEIALERGKRGFLVYSSLTHAAHEVPSAAPLIERDYTLAATAYVRFLDEPRDGAFDAAEIVAQFERAAPSGGAR